METNKTEENQVDKIISEIISNTNDFLSAEFSIQLKEIKLSMHETISLIGAVIVNLFINHIVKVSALSGKDALIVLDSLDLPGILKSTLDNNET